MVDEERADNQIKQNSRAVFTMNIDHEAKADMLAVYEDLLNTIWGKMLPTLGTVTVVTIVGRAISRTATEYPLIEQLRVADTGLSFAGIIVELDTADRDHIKAGFSELIANLFDILTKLTGNILVQQLVKEVDVIEIYPGEAQ